MKDPRLEKLSQQLIRYSCGLKKGERVLIENFGVERELIAALVTEAYAVGAKPVVVLRDKMVERALLMGGTAEQWDEEAKRDAERMLEMDAYIGIRAGDNGYETADVPPEKVKLYLQHYSKPVHSEIRVPHTRWVVLRYPTASMAQFAETSTEAFEDHYFDVCNLDYYKMSLAMDALVTRLEATDEVRIVGRGTDLHFSIKGLPAIKCDGHMNIPDGEVFTAPVRQSVNGVIQYNTPSLYQDHVFNDMRLTFENGKIVKAESSDTVRCNQIFDTDEGARYVGEFAIGVNPYITKAIKDTLFDEKIAGSFHFTPGNSYDECPNGNKSAVHWDLVCIQTPEYGGGEMYFDGVLVRKDGLFVTEDLKGLNPENLK
ncbi:MAG: aminopeptidase [Clostridia bacterium]